MSTKVFVLLVGCFLLLSIGCKQESSKRTQITSGPSNDGTVRYSPDGSQVAFISDRSGSQAIWKVTSDGAQATQLTPEQNWLAWVRWSPDGGKIVYASDKEAPPDIWVVSSTGGEPTRLTTEPMAANVDYFLAWCS